MSARSLARSMLPLPSAFNIGAIVAQHRDARGGAAANSTTNKARIADKAVVTQILPHIHPIALPPGHIADDYADAVWQISTQPGPLHDKPLS